PYGHVAQTNKAQMNRKAELGEAPRGPNHLVKITFSVASRSSAFRKSVWATGPHLGCYNQHEFSNTFLACYRASTLSTVVALDFPGDILVAAVDFVNQFELFDGLFLFVHAFKH